MENYTSVRNATLRDYLRVLFKHKAVIVASFFTVLIVVYIGLALRTPVYQSQVKMLVSAQMETEAVYYQGIRLGRFIAITHSEIVTSNPVIERAVKALGLHNRPLDYEKKFSSWLKAALIDYRIKKLNNRIKELTPEQKKTFLFRRAVGNLKSRIKLNPIKDTNLFTITVRDFSPVGAAVIANVVSRSYVIFDLEQQFAELTIQYGEKHSIAKQLKDKIEEMQKTLHGKPLPDIEAIGPASVKIIEQAQISFEPVRKVGKNTTLFFAFIMSGFLGILLAFGFEYLDQTFKSPQDIETLLNIPVLGSVPKIKKQLKQRALIPDSKKTAHYAKAFQNLSDQIYLLLKDKNLNSLLITDAEGSEETASIIVNLGIYLAQKAGNKVLIIDANLRNPSIHKILDVSDSKGFTDVLEDKEAFDTVVRNVDSNLDVLTSGNTELNPSTLLSSSMMTDVMKKAKDRYDVVLISCADIRSFTDAAMLSSFIDGVVIVVNEGKVRRMVLKDTIVPLEKKNINFVGVILNNRTYAIPKIFYKLT